MVKKRDLVKCVIFTIITFGIYGMYWMAKMTDDAKTLSNDNTMQSGGMVVLLTIVTCGIFGIYWAYRMGQMLYKAEQDKNIPNPKDNSVLYLVLELFISIVGWILIQNQINEMAQ